MDAQTLITSFHAISDQLADLINDLTVYLSANSTQTSRRLPSGYSDQYAKRFFKRIQYVDSHALWVGATDHFGSRGVLHSPSGKRTSAHRVYYALTHPETQLPEYARLHKECEENLCVSHWRPARLLPDEDSPRPATLTPSPRPRNTHCKYGHEKSYVYPQNPSRPPRWVCKICDADRKTQKNRAAI